MAADTEVWYPDYYAGTRSTGSATMIDSTHELFLCNMYAPFLGSVI